MSKGIIMGNGRNRMGGFKKGVALPMTTIVVVAIVMLVLAVVAVFFADSGGSTMSSIEARRIFDNGCRALESECSSGGDPYSYSYQICGVVNIGDKGTPFGNKFLDACSQLGYVAEGQKTQYCISCLQACTSAISCDFEVLNV